MEIAKVFETGRDQGVREEREKLCPICWKPISVFIR